MIWKEYTLILFWSMYIYIFVQFLWLFTGFSNAVFKCWSASWDGKFIALDNIYLVVWYEINTSLQSGKPIPYWLYKLHGLNISYNCEICGNFTYKGPKAFQRHFAGRFILKLVVLSLNICNLFQSGVMHMA